MIKCRHLMLCNEYSIIRRLKLRSQSVQEIVSNSDVTITVDTRTNTAIKIEANKPDIIILRLFCEVKSVKVEYMF